MFLAFWITQELGAVLPNVKSALRVSKKQVKSWKGVGTGEEAFTYSPHAFPPTVKVSTNNEWPSNGTLSVRGAALLTVTVVKSLSSHGIASMRGVCAYLMCWWKSVPCIQMCSLVLSVDICDYGEVMLVVS